MSIGSYLPDQRCRAGLAWNLSSVTREGTPHPKPIHRFQALLHGSPRGFFRISWVRRLPNLNEFFVHHEDVRRANGRGPRTNSPAMDAALWRNVSRAPWFLARRLRGAGLELEWAGTANTVRARRGEPTVRIAGLPGELLLYLFGRQRAAQVEVSGPADAVKAVRRARFGIYM